jgi:hypothetical protein
MNVDDIELSGALQDSLGNRRGKSQILKTPPIYSVREDIFQKPAHDCVSTFFELACVIQDYSSSSGFGLPGNANCDQDSHLAGRLLSHVTEQWSASGDSVTVT